jgi:hypothetical protein
MELSKVLPKKLTDSQRLKFSAFKEPEGSLSQLQKPAECVYPEPDRYSPCPPNPLFEGPF